MATSPRSKLLRWLIPIAIVSLFAAGYLIHAIQEYRVDTRPIGTVRAVIAAFIDSELRAYDCRKAASHRLKWPTKLIYPQLLGYSDSHATWAVVSESTPVSSDYVLSIVRSGRSEVICTGNRSLYSSVMCNDLVYVPVIESGHLKLSRYRLNGKSAGDIVLDIDNIAGSGPTIAVAPNGLIAAAFGKRGYSEGSYIYLFESNGDFKSRLAMGDSPRFSGHGRYLAFKEMKLGRGENSIRGTGQIVIIDLKTGRKRSVCVAEPGCSGDESYARSRLRDYQVSPDGKSLVCSYTQGWPVPTATQRLYVVDLTSNIPKWHKLPLQVLPGWVVLDELPNSSVYIREE